MPPMRDEGDQCEEKQHVFKHVRLATHRGIVETGEPETHLLSHDEPPGLHREQWNQGDEADQRTNDDLQREDASKSPRPRFSVPANAPEALSTGIAAAAMPMKKQHLHSPTITGEPKTGAKRASPPSRAATSRSGTTVAPSPVIAVVIEAVSCTSESASEHSLGEDRDLGTDPTEKQDRHEDHRDDLGHERKRLFLHLRHGLEQTDDQAHQKAGPRIGAETSSVSIKASLTSARFSVSMRQPLREAANHRSRADAGHQLEGDRSHPSTRTNRSSLNGREISTGGSIIMPMEMSRLAITMSMTRNGR